MLLPNIHVFDQKMNSNKKQTYCFGSRHYSNTINITEYAKINLRPKKLVEFFKGSCSICGRNKLQIFPKKMTRGSDFIKDARCKRGH